MELGSPEKQEDGSDIIAIEVMNNFQIEYLSKESGFHTTPPYDSTDLKIYIGQLAQLYEIYSKKWFSKVVFPSLFLSRLQHVWNTNDKQPYSGVVNEMSPIRVCQEWCPEKLIVMAREFKIIWRLDNVLYKPVKTKIVSGTGALEVTSEQIPLHNDESRLSLKTTLRSRALRKVRQARLLASISKAISDKLTLRYYEKYGELENRDSGSVLSSNSESDL
jgi:hypothetical protein